MNNIIFGYQDNQIKVKINEQEPTTIEDTNIALLDENNFYKRFQADIVKDANTKTSITRIAQILGGILDIAVDSNYKRTLDGIDTIIDESTKDNETILKNILKTSTVGSNTQISDAEYVFWESGFASEKICRSNPEKIGTPASILDTLNKEQPNMYYPQPGTTITFNPSFTQRLGFPYELTWSCSANDDGTFNVTISYVRNGVETNMVSIVSPPPNHDRGGFSKYSFGNEEKNALINTGTLPYEEIYRHLLIKELADVAQVWMYFAFIVINGMSAIGNRNRSLMITTDSVVYLFCKLLNISSIYTGSRQGVTSGGCTLKQYLIGEPNYPKKLLNMVDIARKRIFGNNAAIQLGINIMFVDLNKFEYYRIEGDKLKRTYGGVNVNTDLKRTGIKDLFSHYSDVISARNTEIDRLTEELKLAVIASRPADEAAVTAYYDNYCRKIEEQKVPQFITKLPSKNYILNPSVLLTDFAAIVGYAVPPSILGIDITKLEPDTGAGPGPAPVTLELTGATGGRKKHININRINMNKKKTFTKRGGGKHEYVNDTGYYECFVLCYIYKFFFEEKKISIDIIEKYSEFQSLFAMYYDIYVSYINLGIKDDNFNTIFPKGNVDYILEHISDEDIIYIGNYMSQFIYFAQDIDEENYLLNYEIVVVNEFVNEYMHNNSAVFSPRRSPRFTGTECIPSTLCGGREDFVTKNRIQGTPLHLNGHCYDISSVLRLKNEDKKFIDPYTRTFFNPKDQKNIHNCTVKGGKLKGTKKHRITKKHIKLNKRRTTKKHRMNKKHRMTKNHRITKKHYKDN